MCLFACPQRMEHVHVSEVTQLGNVRRMQDSQVSYNVFGRITWAERKYTSKVSRSG